MEISYMTRAALFFSNFTGGTRLACFWRTCNEIPIA